MQIVIEIPDKEIPKNQSIINISLSFVDGKVADAHGYGFYQLPEHGRLIDVDEIQFENSEFDTYGDYCIAFDAIDDAPTILEGEKGERK